MLKRKKICTNGNKFCTNLFWKINKQKTKFLKLTSGNYNQKVKWSKKMWKRAENQFLYVCVEIPSKRASHRHWLLSQLFGDRWYPGPHGGLLSLINGHWGAVSKCRVRRASCSIFVTDQSVELHLPLLVIVVNVNVYQRIDSSWANAVTCKILE